MKGKVTPNLNELLEKDKEELERIKLALEVHNYNKNIEFEKRKYRTETIRIIAIAIISSVITLTSTYLFKIFDEKSEEKKASRSELSKLKIKYLETSDPVLRNKYACEIASLYNPQDDNYVNKKKKEFETICNKINQTQEVIQKEKEIITQANNIDSNIKNKLSRADKVIFELEEKKKQEGSLDTNETRLLENATKEIETLADSDEPLAQAIQSTNTISETKISQIKTVTLEDEKYKNRKILNTSEVKWAKEGYFLSFQDSIRIRIQYLDSEKGIQVEICNTTAPEPCKLPVATKQWVKTDQPYIFTLKSKHYMLSLKAIDRAGKNPFTLAAFITLSELENSFSE